MSGAIDRRTFLKLAAGGAAGVAAIGSYSYVLPRARGAYVRLTRPNVTHLTTPETSEVLYNGITLPSPWPPYRQKLERDLEFPPYLLQPPDVIPIDLGRQLFVDDFLIDECELDRSYHSATYIASNPIFHAATPWERYDEYADRTHQPQRPTAMPFSDGVWFDPTDRVFKLWYSAGYSGVTCLAVSHDGIEWHRPALDVVPGTNIVLDEVRDSSTVWLDHDASNPGARFKMAHYALNGQRLRRFCSADGVHWNPAGFGGPSGDRTTFFYNAFRRRWVYSLREHPDLQRYVGRHRRYWEAKDFFGLTPWTNEEAVAWVAADDLDRPRTDIRSAPELYNLDCVAYESVLLGLFSIYYGELESRHKPNRILIGFSRDGFHWARPSRAPFIGVSEHPGDWNWTNVQSAGGCCLVVGDRLFFYVSGRAGVPGTGSAGACSTGLATLRRDGFVSLDAPSEAPPRAAGFAPRLRSITTRPVRFSGSVLFVNVAMDDGNGELRAEVLDRDGAAIDRLSASRCVPVRTDSTRARVEWSGASLADLAGEPVRLRFYLRNGRLYSFWVAADAGGASQGFVAAGGPDFTGPKDISS